MRINLLIILGRKIPPSVQLGSAETNRGEPESCQSQVFNFRFGCLCYFMLSTKQLLCSIQQLLLYQLQQQYSSYYLLNGCYNYSNYSSTTLATTIQLLLATSTLYYMEAITIKQLLLLYTIWQLLQKWLQQFYGSYYIVGIMTIYQQHKQPNL